MHSGPTKNAMLAQPMKSGELCCQRLFEQNTFRLLASIFITNVRCCCFFGFFLNGILFGVHQRLTVCFPNSVAVIDDDYDDDDDDVTKVCL